MSLKCSVPLLLLSDSCTYVAKKEPKKESLQLHGGLGLPILLQCMKQTLGGCNFLLDWAIHLKFCVWAWYAIFFNCRKNILLCINAYIDFGRCHLRAGSVATEVYELGSPEKRQFYLKCSCLCCALKEITRSLVWRALLSGLPVSLYLTFRSRQFCVKPLWPWAAVITETNWQCLTEKLLLLDLGRFWQPYFMRTDVFMLRSSFPSIFLLPCVTNLWYMVLCSSISNRPIFFFL
jgi:hypothetical protein